jgi:hypothetical protein
MFIACVIVSLVLAFLSLGSGLAKINEVPQVKQLLQHVGAWGIARPLGMLEIAGAVGLIAGLVVAPIGMAAAAGLTIYFLGAVAAHLRVRDPLMQVLNPFVPMLIAMLALWLRLRTA